MAADMVTTKTVVLSSFQFERAFKLIENMLNFSRKVVHTHKLISAFILAWRLIPL
jgi:hypothetical protein